VDRATPIRQKLMKLGKVVELGDYEKFQCDRTGFGSTGVRLWHFAKECEVVCNIALPYRACCDEIQ
jgi:hypothetical protein